MSRVAVEEAGYDLRSVSSSVFVAAIGDVNDRNTWSGIPYHMLCEARRQGLRFVGLPLKASSKLWRTRRAMWNAATSIRGRRYGGYQFSESFLEALWRQARRDLKRQTIINCFQIYPKSLVEDSSIKKWYFIDQTLTQLFSDYGLGSKLDSETIADALVREAAGYRAATGIVTHSHWAADSLIRAYGIQPEKISIVVPGANIDHDTYALWEETQKKALSRRSSSDVIKLVFVGKDWRRKGLDRLLLGMSIARTKGLQATLRIIGCHANSIPAELRRIPGVEWRGFIDKGVSSSEFVSLVSECDIGCLLSRAEAGGIALREFQALGLVALATDVGGVKDHVCEGAAVLVPPNVSPEAISDRLLALEGDRSYLSRLRLIAYERRADSLWKTSVAQLWQSITSPDRQGRSDAIPA